MLMPQCGEGVPLIPVASFSFSLVQSVLWRRSSSLRMTRQDETTRDRSKWEKPQVSRKALYEHSLKCPLPDHASRYEAPIEQAADLVVRGFLPVRPPHRPTAPHRPREMGETRSKTRPQPSNPRLSVGDEPVWCICHSPGPGPRCPSGGGVRS